ncbi:hypothetical protein QAD02_023264 [Eretmocerus hayati]|uniref:Uncharacterized protein n=1 Tax=Eretmocerus hayati TaxID=131215 RepID=A0ACC2PVL3_9HYME|nr:hypothetical protein QAD02_023264 [Eretmocerus hayati]
MFIICPTEKMMMLKQLLYNCLIRKKSGSSIHRTPNNWLPAIQLKEFEEGRQRLTQAIKEKEDSEFYDFHGVTFTDNEDGVPKIKSAQLVNGGDGEIDAEMLDEDGDDDKNKSQVITNGQGLDPSIVSIDLVSDLEKSENETKKTILNNDSTNQIEEKTETLETNSKAGSDPGT